MMTIMKQLYLQLRSSSWELFAVMSCCFQRVVKDCWHHWCRCRRMGNTHLHTFELLIVNRIVRRHNRVLQECTRHFRNLMRTCIWVLIPIICCYEKLYPMVITRNLMMNWASEEISPKRAYHPASVIATFFPLHEGMIFEPQLKETLLIYIYF